METYHYFNITGHAMSRTPDKYLDTILPVLVGANKKTAVCKLIGNTYFVYDHHKEVITDKVFCEFEEAEIVRMLTAFDY